MNEKGVKFKIDLFLKVFCKIWLFSIRTHHEKIPKNNEKTPKNSAKKRVF